MLNQFFLTNAGRHLLASVQAGEVLSFTKVGIGEGEPISREMMEDMSVLLKPRAYFPIIEVKDNNDGTVSVMTALTNKENDSRFFIKEIGLFAQDPKRGEILYAVCSCGDAADLFSAKTDKVLTITQEIRVDIGNAENVQFVLNDSLVWATKQELYELGGRGRSDETVKKNADDIAALSLKIMMMGNTSGMGGLDENSILISFAELKEEEDFWGYYDEDKRRLVG